MFFMIRSSTPAWLACILLASVAGEPVEGQDAKTLPAVGDQAPDFTMVALDDSKITLSKVLEEGPAVVVVLRGYPGYQCPLCSRQVASLIGSKKAFADKNAKVILVYPGAVDDLESKAEEFLSKMKLPSHFVLVTDPDYEFTEAYGLRWDAPNETAYPSTFVIDRDGKILLAVVSHSHGDRAETKQVIAKLP
jgi:peroxiredoxin